jgi:feruloyl esterase
VGRLGLARHPPHDGALKANRHPFLRRETGILVLHRLLNRGSTRAHGGATFPKNYDGILTGAPAHDRTHLHTLVVWIHQATHEDPGSFIPTNKLMLINNRVVEQCDAIDGVTDGVLEDPLLCSFDPGVLQCQGPEGPDCLTPAQVTAMRNVYAGVRNPRTGELIYRGLPPGSELNALGLAFQQPLPEPAFGGLFKWVFGPTWDWRTFNFDSDMAEVDAVLEPILNATNPDLNRLKRQGGKLILWHGQADPLVPPQPTIDYYERVVAHQARRNFERSEALEDLKETREFARLFMAGSRPLFWWGRARSLRRCFSGRSATNGREA